MNDDRAWVIGQIKERLRYYGSLTTIGVDPSRRGRRAPVQGETLAQIREDLGDCTRCRLHSGRRSIVFGAGSPEADLMFVGEGPGYDEDVQGLPFVGKAGQLLTKIIEAIELTREEVYIANIVKCRPPENRDPEPDEIATCRAFVERQIRAVRPKVICTLGRIAAQALLSTDRPLRDLRGRTFELADAWLVPTYHPAFLLRNPEKKRECWEDMKRVRQLLNERR